MIPGLFSSAMVIFLVYVPRGFELRQPEMDIRLFFSVPGRGETTLTGSYPMDTRRSYIRIGSDGFDNDRPGNSIRCRCIIGAGPDGADFTPTQRGYGEDERYPLI